MRHHRRSIRLQDYDYTQSGAYFVTLCAHEQRCVFGEIVEGAMVLNAWGDIVQEEWDQTAVLRPNVELDAWVVMPNHVHGILVILDQPTSKIATASQPKHGVTENNVAANSLGSIVRTFKGAVTRRLNALPRPPGHPIWQRNYYEQIIRNEEHLNHIRTYIALNPARWADDKLYVKPRHTP